MHNCAGIVSFEPDINKLIQNVEAIENQVNQIFIVDNASLNYVDIENVMSKYDKVNIIRNIENLGVATALNQIVKAANKEKYEWVLLLDQDSVCSSNLITEYNKYINIDKIALISPYIIDNYKMTVNDYLKLEMKPYNVISSAITSASYIKIEVWLKLGGFLESYFIDKVDTEYSMRLFINGYTQIRCNATYIIHEIGKSEKTILYIFYKKWPNDHTEAWGYRSNHSSLRIFL